MRRIALSLLAIQAALAAAAPARAAPARGASASATGSASATVVQAAGVRAIAALDFEQVNVPHSGDTAVSVGIVPRKGAGPARFAITSEAGRHFALSIPRALDFGAGTGTAKAPLAARLRVARLPSANSSEIPQGAIAAEQLFAVSGRLDVTAGARPGRYRGNVPVTIVFE